MARSRHSEDLWTLLRGMQGKNRRERLTGRRIQVIPRDLCGFSLEKNLDYPCEDPRRKILPGREYHMSPLSAKSVSLYESEVSVHRDPQVPAPLGRLYVCSRSLNCEGVSQARCGDLDGMSFSKTGRWKGLVDDGYAHRIWMSFGRSRTSWYDSVRSCRRGEHRGSAMREV